MPIPPFDADGYLEPGRHTATAEEVKATLVDGFPQSKNRPTLFDAWQTHLETLSYLIKVQGQWLGGSFVSTKIDPGDVDSVSLFDGEFFDSLPLQHRRLIDYMCSGHNAVPYWFCDAFYVALYPADHPGHDLMTQTLAYWDYWWGHTREDPDGQRRERGYLEVSE